MKKHSPNFFENLQEADTAKNNRAATFFWTVVLIATFMLGLSVTKTKAQLRLNRDSVSFYTPKIGDSIIVGKYTVVNNGYSRGYFVQRDTIPVLMQVCDTSETKGIGIIKKDTSDNRLSVFRIVDSDSYFDALSVSHFYPIIIYGYQVTESYEHGALEAHNTENPYYICSGCTKYKTTYLNHKKQPLPDRLIVWMAITRKEL